MDSQEPHLQKTWSQRRIKNMHETGNRRFGKYRDIQKCRA